MGWCHNEPVLCKNSPVSCQMRLLQNKLIVDPMLRLQDWFPDFVQDSVFDSPYKSIEHMTIKRSWHKNKIGPGSVLRRVGYSDKMPSVAQSRVLQAWRLERGEKSKVKADLHIRVGGLGLVSGSGWHWGHCRHLITLGARSPRPSHWLSSASPLAGAGHWLPPLRRVSWVATRGSIFPGQGHGQAASAASSSVALPFPHRNQRSQAVRDCGLHYRAHRTNVTPSHVERNCLRKDCSKGVESLCKLSLLFRYHLAIFILCVA